MTAPATGELNLITIPISHYCEKARWGLERLGIPYREERHLQVFHYLRTFLVSRGPSVPVLVAGNRVVKDSTEILKYLDNYADPDLRLYPDDPYLRTQVERWEDQFDEVLGVESRRWVYAQFQSRPMDALRANLEGVPAIERWLLPLLFPVFFAVIYVLLKPTPANVDGGLNRIWELVQQTDRLLARGHRYLLGDTLTAADVALACMMAPLVLPRNYGIRLPDIDTFPEQGRATIRAFRATDTGAYTMNLFERVKPPVRYPD